MDTEIDLDKIQAAIAKMTPEEIRAQLLEIKTKQKVSSKKYYKPEVAKKSRKKKSLVAKAMVEQAKALGLYGDIMSEAEVRANEVLGAEQLPTEAE